MNHQTIPKQIAREYYNALYGAKINFASFDICEKVPTIISALSLSFGILSLAFVDFNGKIQGAALLILGIIGLLLKSRDSQKNEYLSSGNKLLDLSKALERLHLKALNPENHSDVEIHSTLEELQDQHNEINLSPPVFLSSWCAHYKLFSEHNAEWMIDELQLTWKDKFPLSFRVTAIGLITGLVIWLSVIGAQFIKQEYLCNKDSQNTPTAVQLEVPLTKANQLPIEMLAKTVSADSNTTKYLESPKEPEIESE
jgi:hypothetical protein